MKNLALTLLLLAVVGLVVADRGDDDSRHRDNHINSHGPSDAQIVSTLLIGNNQTQITYGFRADNNGVRLGLDYRPNVNVSASVSFAVRVDGLLEWLPSNGRGFHYGHDVPSHIFGFVNWNPIQIQGPDTAGTVNFTASTTDGYATVIATVSQIPISFPYANKTYVLNPNTIKFTINLNLTTYHYHFNTSRLAFRVKLESQDRYHLHDDRALTPDNDTFSDSPHHSGRVSLTDPAVSDAFQIGDPNSITGVVTWLSDVVVDGQITNVVSSPTVPCANNDGFNNAPVCDQFFLTINATTPRIVNYDPSAGAATAAVGTSSSSASTLDSVVSVFVLCLLSLLAKF